MIDLKDFNRDYTHKFCVSKTVYEAFQNCSGDLNPLHTDMSFAVKNGFRSCVMYGNILNAFVSYFIGMMLPSPDVIIHSQDIIFKNPVFLNDVLLFTASPDGIYESVNTIQYKFQFTNESNKVVAKGHVQIGGL